MEKKTLKQRTVIFCLVLMAAIYVGCGRNNNSGMESDESQSTKTQSEGAASDGKSSAASTKNESAGVGATGISGALSDTDTAANDMMDDVADAVDDMANVDYSDYDSAHDYLFGQIGKAGKSSKYEVRNKDREAKSYDASDRSKKGFRYEIYDTSKGDGEKYGVFYVDQKTGKIYKENENGQGIEEYRTEKSKNN